MWAAGSAIALAAGALGLRARTRGRLRAARRINLDRVLSVAQRKPEELLDLAVLAVTAAEECRRAHDVPHASVWMRLRDSQQFALLAELGQPCPDAYERARRCAEHGLKVRDCFWLLERGERRDLLLCVQSQGAVEFEILLHSVTAVDNRVFEALERAKAPVRAALHKQTWLDRLEADFAGKSASLEAQVHDLRSPLTALRLSAFDLVDNAEKMAPATLRDVAGTVAAATEAVVLAIESLLRKSDRPSDLQLHPRNPASLALARIRILMSLANAKDIRVEAFEAAELSGFLVDEVWFGRVIENLVGNAIKYSPRGATVRVSWELVEGEFHLHVDDEGPGFAEGERETVFLPGMIGKAETTAGEGKTGMGLWIARQAMRAMGGRIWVQKRKLPGARVSLALPRAPQVPLAK
jgi:signal transduction histidine kinase